MKFCKDCKYYLNENNPTYDKCIRKMKEIASPITGEKSYSGILYCDLERTSSWFGSLFFGDCGKSGLKFEHKNSEKKQGAVFDCSLI